MKQTQAPTLAGAVFFGLLVVAPWLAAPALDVSEIWRRDNLQKGARISRSTPVPSSIWQIICRRLGMRPA